MHKQNCVDTHEIHRLGHERRRTGGLNVPNSYRPLQKEMVVGGFVSTFDLFEKDLKILSIESKIVATLMLSNAFGFGRRG